MGYPVCEVHLDGVSRESVPGVKKVSSSHAKGETRFLTENAADEKPLKNIAAATGDICRSVESASYEKKGRFSRK